MQVRSYFLDDGEYTPVAYPKDKIFIHHTAGSFRPDYVIDGWNRDRLRSGGRRKTATAYLIGGPSLRGDTKWDGIILQAFPEQYWAVHLNGWEMYHLDKTSIGIEICNFGPLTKSANGNFYNFVDQQMPKDQVVTLDTPFRGESYYHRYSDAQLKALGELLEYLGECYNIDLKKGLQEWIAKEDLKLPPGLDVQAQQKWLNQHGFVGPDGDPLVEDGIHGPKTTYALQSVGQNAFEYNALAVKGSPGLWTHTNVRTDKSDCFPQPQLLELIRRL